MYKTNAKLLNLVYRRTADNSQHILVDNKHYTFIATYINVTAMKISFQLAAALRTFASQTTHD